MKHQKCWDSFTFSHCGEVSHEKREKITTRNRSDENSTKLQLSRLNIATKMNSKNIFFLISFFSSLRYVAAIFAVCVSPLSRSHQRKNNLWKHGRMRENISVNIALKAFSRLITTPKEIYRKQQQQKISRERSAPTTTIKLRLVTLYLADISIKHSVPLARLWPVRVLCVCTTHSQR